jgi:hypothetical protein
MNGTGQADEAENGGSGASKPIPDSDSFSPSSEQTRPESPKCIHGLTLNEECADCQYIYNEGRKE